MSAEITAGRRCIFCDHRADSLEHIFPDWINNIFVPGNLGPVDSVHLQVVTGDATQNSQRRFSANKLAQLTARIVCSRCNGGWMGAMEKRARPLLQQAILGYQSTFSQEEQVFVAAWATKIAMLGEAIMKYPDSFTAEDRRLVWQQQRPPLHSMVYFAIYGGLNVWTAYVRSLGEVTVDGTPFTNVYIHTIQIGRLVIQVRGFPSLPLSDNSALKQIAESRYIEIPIFPPVERCQWPPKFVFDDDSLARYTAAGKEPPGPPPHAL